VQSCLRPRAKDIEALPEPEVAEPQPTSQTRYPSQAPRYEQEIHFCTTPDGVQLAYSCIGSGRRWSRRKLDDPLEFDFEPDLASLYIELSRDHN